LSSRTVRLAHREAAGALLACQVLLALGAQAVRPRARAAAAPCSAREVLLAIRDEMGDDPDGILKLVEWLRSPAPVRNVTACGTCITKNAGSTEPYSKLMETLHTPLPL
jgi:hypothetical protein